MSPHKNIFSPFLNFSGLLNQYRENCTPFVEEHCCHLHWKGPTVKPQFVPSLYTFSISHIDSLQIIYLNKDPRAKQNLWAKLSLTPFYSEYPILPNLFLLSSFLCSPLFSSPPSISLFTPAAACHQRWRAGTPRWICRWVSSGNGHHWEDKRRKFDRVSVLSGRIRKDVGLREECGNRDSYLHID